jgi:hypothetical protein
VSERFRLSLRQVSLPALLRPLVRARKTGVLQLTRGGVAKTVYLSAGRLIFATSTDPDDRLGELLLAKGVITYRALEDSVQALRAGKRQGTLFVESGAIRSRDLISGVTEQVKEIICSVFRWEDGEAEFVEGDLPSREVIVLRMSTEELLLEGIRGVSAWSRIRAGAGPLEQLYTLGPGASVLVTGLALEEHELSLVSFLDGPASLEEICAASPQSDFQVCRSVWGLWAAGVLDRIPQDVEPTRRTPPEQAPPPSEVVRSASVGREVELFNERHRMLFELLSYTLREAAAPFFARALDRARAEQPLLFAGVGLEPSGELDRVRLRRNIVSGEIASYRRGLDRLLELEAAMAREHMGEKKAAIIEDGLLALQEQQLQRRGGRP